MLRDLNCDLGEGEPLARTHALMGCVTSVNIACGGHAGDIASMERCVSLAAERHLRIGAHPGPWDRQTQGRAAVQLSAEELELLLLHQVSALERICRQHKTRLHHIKLHGALYHLSESDLLIGQRYLQAVHHWWPQTKIYVRAGSWLVEKAKTLGVPVWREAFADRGYESDGRLVARTSPGALISKPQSVARRVDQLRRSAVLEAHDGTRLSLEAETICVHSDTPNALALAKAAAQALGLRRRVKR